MTSQNIKTIRIQTDIVLDFSKASDTVPHDKLLYKLRHYYDKITEDII